MPVYEYEDMRTGQILEEFKTVDQRDAVPSHLRRITCPRRVGFLGGLTEPHTADHTVPKAFREYELAGNDVRKIERETGFSRDHIRRVWNFLLLALFVISMPAGASDITAGKIFVSGERNIDHNDLNNIVGAATINPSFITSKTTGSPSASDSFLFYSAAAGAFRKSTIATLILNNTNLITGQTTLLTPALDDYVLAYDASAGLLAKVPFLTLVPIGLHTNWATPDPITTSLLGYDSGSGGYFSLTRSNLFYQFGNFATFTNLAFHSAPIASDSLLIWSTAGATNKQMTLAGMITNATAATYATNGDSMLIYSTNQAQVVRASVSQLKPTRYDVAEMTIGTSAAAVTNGTHTLPGTPQITHWVLKCVTTDLGYGVGSELDLPDFFVSSGAPAFAAKADSTGFYVVQNGAAQTLRASAPVGGAAAITAASWHLKGYFIYYQ